MTELERLLTAQFERMEQRHQDETKALREQLDAQQRSLERLQAQLGSTLSEYEKHCASLHAAFVALEKSTRSELASMGRSLDQTNRATGVALGSLNCSVAGVTSSLESLSKELNALLKAQS
ncbi:mobilization protein (plasmid) [Aeromonas caviae]|jgi:septal ring factor EnvC (AmiA/AmiB activator)|uniref:mobilization protein n=1 Tax=Aeromonas TaxID=642 RepID=UPI001D09CD48|nr:mobilization protein [Aeromonas caviae]UDN29150.1 mobilization protein [Aeromonas caviae]